MQDLHNNWNKRHHCKWPVCITLYASIVKSSQNEIIQIFLLDLIIVKIMILCKVAFPNKTFSISILLFSIFKYSLFI